MIRYTEIFIILKHNDERLSEGLSCNNIFWEYTQNTNMTYPTINKIDLRYECGNK